MRARTNERFKRKFKRDSKPLVSLGDLAKLPRAFEQRGERGSCSCWSVQLCIHKHKKTGLSGNGEPRDSTLERVLRPREVLTVRAD